MRIIKPKKLEKGDVIGIIAPASPPKDYSKIDNGIKYLEGLGYRVELGKHIYSKRGYLAGEDSERLEDLHSMFENKNVKAIIAVRGGFGSTRILDKINYRLIQHNPKIFVGYSDICAIQMAFYTKCNLLTFAGPMLSVDFGDEIEPFTEEAFWRMVTSTKKIGRMNNPEGEKFFTLTKKRGGGKILGGNLSILSALAGTPYFPDFKNAVLLLEEIGEAPYRIDRMFTHLEHLGVMKKINGLILGRFVDCFESDSSKSSLSLNEVVADHFSNLKVPVFYNFKHGHIRENLTVPIGLNCKLNSSRYIIEIDENAVI